MIRKTKTKSASTGTRLVVEAAPGLTIAPGDTPLTRLNYFDGKRLDAEDLRLEQEAQRRLVQLSNLAGGFGIVHGFDTQLAGGDRLAVGPGQAIDADGRVLLLPQGVEVSITELIARSRLEPRTHVDRPGAPAESLTTRPFRDCEPVEHAPDVVGLDPGLWLITIAHAEFLCGEEDVYGKLCEQACVTSTERPYRVEGVVLRAHPLELDTPLVSSAAVPLTAKHQRSRVASAYFADQRERLASLISSAGLRGQVWCFGAELAAGEVALGVLSRKGMSNLWFDAWIARRERMLSPARSYWAQRMAMRPWPEFLAQILQFQCQLAALLGEIAEHPPVALCPPEQPPEGEDRPGLRPLGLTGSLAASLRLVSLLGFGALTAQRIAAKRVLIEGGIVELPPAGYLPVDPGSSLAIDEQVRRMLGDGVDLRFCVVRPDDVARELEGAQHMDRISLLRGLDDAAAKPPVDILVPDGELVERRVPREGLGFRAKLAVGTLPPSDLRPSWRQLVSDIDRWMPNRSGYRGAARAAPRLGGGGQLHLAALTRAGVAVDLDVERLARVADSPVGAATLNQMFAKLGVVAEVEVGPEPPPGVIPSPQPSEPRPSSTGLWLDMSCDGDPFELPIGSAMNASFLLRMGSAGSLIEYRLTGSLRLESRGDLDDDQGRPHGRRVIGTLTGSETQVGLGVAEATSSSRFGVEIIDLRPSGSAAMLVALRPVNALLDNDVVVAWDGQALEVSGLWVRQPLGQVGAQQSALVFSDLERDDAVHEPDDLDHRAALEALAAIANATDDPGFVKEATAKLFPPRALDTSLEVRGVHDWVLFHARHRKQCGAEPGPAPRPRPARYRVYTRAVANVDELEVVIEQLQQDGELLGQFQFTELGTVEFEPGVATLADSVEDIEQLWPHGDERELAWAGVAVTTAGAEQLARARLLALEELIEDQSPASDGQLSRVLEQVPAVFEPGDAEGVIVLLTLPQRPALRVSLYFAARAVIQQLLEPDVPEGEGIDWLLETFAEAMTHVGELELVDGEITNFEADQDVSLVEPNHLIGYRHEAEQTSPEGRDLAAVARRVFEFVGVETTDVPFTQVELERWSNERGDVVLVGVGDVDTGEVPLI